MRSRAPLASCLALTMAALLGQRLGPFWLQSSPAGMEATALHPPPKMHTVTALCPTPQGVCGRLASLMGQLSTPGPQVQTWDGVETPRPQMLRFCDADGAGRTGSVESPL